MAGGYDIPLPKPGTLPPELLPLVEQVMRYKALQDQYAANPLMQHLAPDATIRYVTNPDSGFNVGGALTIRPGQPVGYALGLGFKREF